MQHTKNKFPLIYWFTKTIPYCCALLFAYSGIIKLMEYDEFRVQLGQSAMLLNMTGFITWFIPAIELIIALMLIWSDKKAQLIGIHLFIGLMVLFCAYILAILNFSEKIPCGCGGILGKLGSWRAHLLLNIAFLAIAIIYYISLSRQVGRKPLMIISTLIAFILAAIIVVVVLFLRVDKHPNYRFNSFKRDFLQARKLKPVANLDLKRPDYYFAGAIDEKLYLGNSAVIDRLLKVHSDLKDSMILKLQLPKFSYRSIKLIVETPWFYLSDGSGFSLFRGDLETLKATAYLKNTWYFRAVPLSSGSIALLSMKDRTNKLAKKSKPDEPEVFYNNILKEQLGEGMFSTSGSLIYEPKKQRLLYLYNYRNEYLIMDTAFNLIHTGKTIDTVSRAKLKIGNIGDGKQYILQQSLLVNGSSCINGDYLYINSNLLSKDEAPEVFEKHSVIDVYNYTMQKYLYSFYIPVFKDRKVREFRVTNSNTLTALQGNYLVGYVLNDILVHKNTGKR